jgi:hypothetical protein
MREFENAERRDPGTQWEDAGVYLGYVLGVFDLMGDSLCGTDRVNVRQVSAIVAKYLNEHPEQWSQSASLLVTRALRAAFPCR